MRISIFQLENNKTYKDEYLSMMKVLTSKCITFDKKEYTYFDYVNIELFHNWKFRGTYLDCYEYLDNIGINLKSKKISKESFLNFLEFLLNMQLLMNNIKYYSERTKFSIKCKSILVHNIPLILDSFGYQAYSLEDRIIILEKSITYDDLGSILPDDIYELLLSYKNINNNGIKMKRLILYKIYDYMNKDSDKYKSFHSTLYTSMKTVITKMGVIGDIDKKYKDISNYKIRKYYDNCFQIMCYLIQTENILKYKDEIKGEGE